MELNQRITEHQNHFTKSERKIADYLLDNPDVAAFHSLNELAGKIGISTTSVIRFARTLGYRGFSELQDVVRNDILVNPDSKKTLPERLEFQTAVPDNRLLVESFQKDVKNIEQTMKVQNNEDLECAVRMIGEAENVYVLGMRSSFSTAYYMTSRLAEIRGNVRLIQSSGQLYPEEIVSAGEKDVCIAYLFPRYSKMSSTILSWLKNAGCRIILFTSLNYQVVKGYGDIILPCALGSISYKNTFVAPLCLSNYLIAALVRKDPERAQRTLQKTEEILNEGFYLGL